MVQGRVGLNVDLAGGAAAVGQRGTSKSAVSRRFVVKTASQLAAVEEGERGF